MIDSLECLDESVKEKIKKSIKYVGSELKDLGSGYKQGTTSTNTTPGRTLKRSFHGAAVGSVVGSAISVSQGNDTDKTANKTRKSQGKDTVASTRTSNNDYD